jgi:hypothetical protein
MRTYSVNDIRQFFIDELNDKAFTIDRTGQKTIELLGASFLADEPAIFGEPNRDYIDAELQWYESESTNVNDIFEDKDAPQAWQYAQIVMVRLTLTMVILSMVISSIINMNVPCGN